MSVLDEMARNWVERLCALQLDYCTRLDLLAVEYGRMSEADRDAVQKAVGGEGFVVVLTGLPEPVRRKYMNKQGVPFSIAVNVGKFPSPQTIQRTLEVFSTEMLMDLIGILGQRLLDLCAPAKDRVVAFVAEKVTIGIRSTPDEESSFEDAVLRARKGQA